MPAAQPVTDQLIQDSMVRAVQNVCHSMLRFEAASRMLGMSRAEVLAT